MNKINDFLSSIVILDTETSSFSIAEAEIIEIAFGVMDNGEWNTVAEQFKPCEGITAQAMSTSWITNEDVADKEYYANNTELTDSFLGSGAILVAHNTTYDREVIINNHNMYQLYQHDSVLDKDNWICTLKLAKKLYRDDNFPEFKLGFLWFHLGLHKESTREIHAHRADSDIYMTGKLLERIISDMIDKGELDPTQEIGSQLIAYQNEPIFMNEFPFGKYKGTHPRNIPDDYYMWLLANSDSLNEDSRNYDMNLAHTVRVIMSERLGE
ncbi:hypothetical protein NVP2275O_007 [Vibrio phage 2.275.O._10N.286.54.E11]|nr:hypothetical protein NVP2275O_007 [Vibrio phage 2.275.O._10N.286.54.E11]